MSLSRTHLAAAPLIAAALVAAVPPVSYAEAARPAPYALAPSCGEERDPGWAPAATRLPDPADGHHAYTGNGYLGTRVPPLGAGYDERGGATGWPLFTPRYDGAFVAGLYAHEPATTADRQVLAALPTWTTLDVRVGGESLGPESRISRYRQSVLLRCGVVRTALRWTTADGRVTDLAYEVLTDRSDPHAGAVRLRLTPRWSGEAHLGAGLDWRGARRLARTGGEAGGTETAGHRETGGGTETAGHTEAVGRTEAAGGMEAVGGTEATFRALGTGTAGAVATTLRPDVRGPVRVEADRTYTLVKYVGVDTALTAPDPRAAARAASRRAAARGWRGLFAANAAAWAPLWDADVSVPGHPDLQAWLRAAQYGLLTSAREDGADSIAPTGLSSDNYAGLIFWDAETWMFPGLLVTRPELARSVVEYRHRTRAGAAANAGKLGFEGLFHAWTSGGRGELWTECQSWNPPHCVTQNHLQGDIALAVWQYYLATGDRGWLRERGWPLLKGSAEFWASRVTANADGSYSVKEVAGPDEYSNGVTDGVFTNAGAATALRDATRAAALVGEAAPARWSEIADRIRIPYDAKRKIYLQYAGYTGSRIKQADTVLLTYPLEWPMPAGAAAATLRYYAARTDPDGPAMTDSVHAIDAAAIGEPGCAAYTYLQRAIRPFVRGPFALFSEARGTKAGADDPLSGSPAQDFLTGKGGFLQVFTHGLTGLRLREDGVRLDPTLPPQLAAGVNVRGLRWRGRTYDVLIGARETTVRLTSGTPFTLHTPAGPRHLTSTLTLPTRRPDLTPTTNAARCHPATASSEEPGQYANAAVDGSEATSWIPTTPTSTLTVTLPHPTRITTVTPHWTTPTPPSHRVETSPDATHWQPFHPGTETQHIRLNLTQSPTTEPTRTGIRELTVTRTARP
ncbi:discoidin domain-containing protein [Streptomyces sp. NPDC006638]|uniref:discoidin domain-containing protein n=1 Tax=Streptomyces sp. NPDC006638 TaxID=3157183 RepID=UPI0033A540CD